TIGVGGLYIAEQSQKKEKAWEFVKYYCGIEGQKILAEMKNCVPSLRSIAQNNFNPPPQNISLFVQIEKNAIPETIMVPYWSEVVDEAFPDIDHIYIGKKDLRTGLKEMEAKINRIMKKY
ncbi:MAG: hypothetical protein KKH98_00085, partial [Spirochaetes bacterium]|nr:hypothetical protein [Spirochaetota bacterium]